MVFFEDVFEKRIHLRPKSAKVNSILRNNQYSNNVAGNEQSAVSFSPKWIADVTKRSSKERLKNGTVAAIRMLNRALMQHNFDEGVLLRGWFYLECGDYDSSRDDFVSIIKKSLNSTPMIDGNTLSRAYRGFGCVCAFLNNFEEADFAFSKSLLLDKNKFPTLLGKSVLHLKYNKTLNVESNIDDMNAVVPNIPHGKFIRGLAKYRWGIKHDAMKDFEECIYMCFQTSPMPCHLLALSIKYQIEVMIVEERYKEANEKAKILSNVLQKECRGKEMEDFISFGIRLKCFELPTVKDCKFYENMTRAMMILCFPNCSEYGESRTDKRYKNNAEQSPGEFDRSLIHAANLLENAKKVNARDDYRVYHWQGFANILLGQWNQGFTNFHTALIKFREHGNWSEQSAPKSKLINKTLSYGLFMTRAGLAVEKGRLEHAIQYLTVAEKTQKYIHLTKLKNGEAFLISPLAIWRRALIKMFLVQTKAGHKERKMLLRQVCEDFNIVIDRIHSYPSNARARGYLASAYRQAGKPKHALTELDCALYLIDEYFNIIIKNYYGISNDRNGDDRDVSNIEKMQRQKFLPLVQTLYLERAACFITLNAFGDANEDLDAYDNHSDIVNINNLDDNDKKTSPAVALRVRLHLERNERPEALKLSTTLLWTSSFESETSTFRLWAQHQHIICLIINGLYENAERHCNSAIDEMTTNNTKGIEHIIDLRARLRVQNGNVDMAIADFVEAYRRQQRFNVVSNDLLALRAIYPVVGDNGWIDEIDLYTKCTQKLSIAIRTISTKHFSTRKKLHDHRSRQMFEPFYLYTYRGVMLIHLHKYKDAFADFEHALNHLEQGDREKVTNSPQGNFANADSNYQQSSNSSYIAFHGLKMYLIVKSFMAYNGGIALLLDGKYEKAIIWFKLAVTSHEKLLNKNKGLFETYSKPERKLYENRLKVIKYFHCIANFASGNTKEGKKCIKELGSKTIMKLLQKRKRKSKTFSSIPTMDVMDGCLNHSTKNKIVRNYIKKEGISYINNNLIVVRAGAFSTKTRPVIFWPHFSKCSILDSLPSMERFSILSYAINNVRNRDDIVTAPCNRIMETHLDDAVDHSMQVPTITPQTKHGEMPTLKHAEKHIADSHMYTNHSVNEFNKPNSLVVPKLNAAAVDNHIYELRQRKVELTRAILESGNACMDIINENVVKTEQQMKEEDDINIGRIIEEEQIRVISSRQKQNRVSTRRGGRRENGNVDTANRLIAPKNDDDSSFTWKSLGFEGKFDDQHEIFAGYPSFSEDGDDGDKLATSSSEIEEESYYSSAEEVIF